MKIFSERNTCAVQGQREAVFAELFEFSSLFRPFNKASLDPRPVPMVLVDSRVEYERCNTSYEFNAFVQLESKKKNEVNKYPFILDEEGYVSPGLARVILREIADEKAACLKPIDCPDDISVKMANWFGIIAMDYLIYNDAPSLGRSMKGVFEWGYIPLVWKGNWPNGFALAYCVSILPHRQLPACCIPTPEQLAAGGYGPDGKPLKRAKPVKPSMTAPAIELLVVTPASWKSLTTGDAAAAFAGHFAALALTPACQQVLAQVAQAVRGLAVEGRNLVVRCTDADGQELVLTGAPPYAGTLRGLPASCAAVVRRHNGLRLARGLQTEAAWHPFAKGLFTMEWDAWWTADPDDPQEPFPTPPLVPVTDGDDIWLLHPSLRRAKVTSATSAEPAVVRMEHEMGTLGKPLPYGAGGVFLRLMLRALTCGKDDGGLAQDGG